MLHYSILGKNLFLPGLPTGSPYKEVTMTKTDYEIKQRQEAQDWERVPYYAQKPEGFDKSETHFVVTLNGRNYRYAYNTPLLIPRCIREILESKAQMQEKAEERAAELMADEQGGVNLGTY